MTELIAGCVIIFVCWFLIGAVCAECWADFILWPLIAMKELIKRFKEIWKG